MRHSERVRYIVYVLWLIGYSQRAIAGALKLRTKQVAGIIEGSVYKDRAAMDDRFRQDRLDDLKSIRFDEAGVALDGGSLDKVPFRIKPLSDRQHRGPLARKLRR
jgi:hypothetical protein